MKNNWILKKNQKKHQKGEGKITKNYFEKSVKLKWNPKLMLNKITEKITEN